MDLHADVQRLREIAIKPIHPDGSGTVPSVQLADLIDEVEGLINKYVCLPDPMLAMLIAVWVALTYCFEQFHYCGYLALRSATPRCGKSRLLRILALFCKGSPSITAIPTAAALFRSTDPVLILDEVDRLRNRDKDLFGDVLAVINCGFEQGSVVNRVERGPGGFVVRSYPVYGPKAFAGIESLADTLADRSFMIQMLRSPDRLPRINIRKMTERADQIRAAFALWAEQHQCPLGDAYENLPDSLPSLAHYDDRFQDIAEPLVVLASLADAERALPENVHGPRLPEVLPRLLTGLAVAGGRREVSYRERQLLAFLEIVEERLIGCEELFIPSADLLAAFQEREELSSIENTTALAAFLRHFELSPRPSPTGKCRGYMIREEWVHEWQGRYKGQASTR